MTLDKRKRVWTFFLIILVLCSQKKKKKEPAEKENKNDFKKGRGVFDRM